MASGGIRGITVKIGGDTTELGRSLSEASKKSNSLQKELRGVNTLLKFNPQNVSLLQQKSELLKQSIEQTKEKLQALVEVQKKVDAGEIEMTEEEYRNLQREIASTEQKLGELTKQQGEFGKEATELEKIEEEFSKMSTKSKELETELKKVDEVLKLDPKNVTLLQQKSDLLKQSVAQAQDKVKLLKETQDKIDSGKIKVSESEYKNLQREISKAESDVKKLIDQQKQFGSVGSQKIAAVGKEMQATGEKIGDVGKKIAPVSLAVGGLGGTALKVAGDFDASMSNVSAISGATGTAFDALRNKAREMSAKMKYSATESADAMSYMAMAGWKTNDMLQGIDGVMQLAASSGADLARTSDIVTDALTGFGKSASDAGRLADIMAAASANSNTNVEMLGETFKYVTPVAGALGYSMEDTTLAIGLMANSGIKASRSGTALKTLLTNMSKPTDSMAAAMEVLGVSLEDGNGHMKSLREVMDDLRSGFGNLMIPQEEYTGKLNELNTAHEKGELTDKQYAKSLEDLTERAYGAEGAEKAKYAAMLAGKEAMPGLLAIVGASAKDYDKLAGAIDNSTGSAEKMAETMQDNLPGQLTILKSQLEELAISFGDIMMPAIRGAVSIVQKLTDKLNGMSAGQKTAVLVIGGIVAAIAPLLLIIAKLMKTVGTIMTYAPMIKSAGSGVVGIVGKMLGPIKTLFSVLAANPIAIVIIAIAGLAAGLIYAYKHSEKFRDVVNGAFDTIKETVGNVVSAIVTFFTESIPNAFDSAGEFLSNGASKIAGSISNFFASTIPNAFSSFGSAISNSFSNIISTVQADVGKIGNAISSGVQKFPYYVGYAIGLIVGKVTKCGIDVYNNVKTTVPKIVNGVTTTLKALPGKIQTTLTDALNKTKTWGTNMVNQAKSAGTKMVTSASNAIKSLPGKIQTTLTSALNKAKTWGSNMAKQAKSAGTKTVTGAVNAIKSLPSKIQTYFSKTIEKAKQFGTNLKNKGTEAARNFGNAVVNGAKTIPSKMTSIGRNIVDGVWHGIQGAGASFKAKVNSFFKGMVNGVKASLGIHSPSRVMSKEVGENIVLGVINGVNKQKKNAKKNADQLSSLYVSAAKEKLKSIKLNNNLSLKEEQTYWKRVATHCKKGSKGYVQAMTNAKNASSKISKEYFKNAKTKLAQMKKSRDVTLKEEEKYWKNVAAHCKKGSANYKEAIANAKKAQKEYKESLTKLNSSYVEDVKKVTETLTTDITKLQDEYLKTVEDRQKSILSSLGLFAEIKQEEEQATKEQLTQNLQDQVQALKEWDETLREIKNRQGMDGDLVTELEGMGIDSLGNLKQIASMTDEELANYINLFQQKREIARQRAIEESAELKAQTDQQIAELTTKAEQDLEALHQQYLKDLKKIGASTKKASKKIGVNITDGIKQGMQAQYGSLLAYVRSMCASIVAEAQASLQIKSPSRVFANSVGKWIPEGIAKGIGDNAKTAISAVKNLSKDMVVDNDFSVGQIERRVEATFQGSVESTKLSNVLLELNKIATILKNTNGQKIVLDTGVLVGETVNKIDNALAINQELKLRGV